MISASHVSLRFGKRTLFEDVNIKFSKGNCYGLIGANGSGKSTFLKVLSREIDTTSGDILLTPGERLAMLKQNHYAYDDYSVMDTVIMGNTKLYEIKTEKDELYSHTEFTDADGMRLGELEAEFLELNGWEAESDAATLLNNLGIEEANHYRMMSELPEKEKVKVLLAQALFGDPDILLLDEPTNGLDIAAIRWLEEFLINFNNCVIIVSHDRYFLNKVCTHIADLDYNKIQLYIGNYDFWYESSQLAARQMKDSNKKKSEKIKELQDFIARFSANASKSKQATSRKKMLEKIELDEIIPSSRKYPFIDFKAERPSGKEILTVENVSKTVDGKQVLKNVSFQMLRGDKIAFIGGNDIAKTTLFRIIMGEIEPDIGKVTFGTTIKKSYFPQDNTKYFVKDETIMEWMGHYYNVDDETILRGFLGRMLFSGEDVFKHVPVLSGGEKARCMLSKAMLEGPNLLVLDDPTAHLDLESITSLNNGLVKYDSELLFASHDHQLVETVSNRLIELLSDGIIDRRMNYDEYLDSEDIQKLKNEIA
ncbi:MAG: ATP-binding cassette domain-containing protein [Bacilli bacterium]